MLFVKKPEIYYFCSLFHFDHNIAKQLLWARISAMYTNTVRATGHTHSPTFLVLPQYVPSWQKDSTNDCGAAMIAINQPSQVSNIIPTNQVDTYFNNYYYSRSFATPKKHNHSDTEIRDKNTTTTQVNIKAHPHLCQWSPSTPTTSLKLPPSGK